SCQITHLWKPCWHRPRRFATGFLKGKMSAMGLLPSVRGIEMGGIGAVAPEPAGDAVARRPGGENLVGDFLAKEHRQGASPGRHQDALWTLRWVEHQLSPPRPARQSPLRYSTVDTRRSPPPRKASRWRR